MILDLLYPPFCLHCKHPMQKHARFCQQCVEQLHLLPLEGHCTKCFGEIPSVSGVCKPCRALSHSLHKLGACFDPLGPAKALLNASKQSEALSIEIASWIVIQHDALNFPSCDLITMVPSHFANPQFSIGKEVAKLMGVPFQPTLKRRFLPEPEFVRKRKCNILNKRILLLDTYMETRATIRNAAFALLDGWPEQINGLTFCAT